jgi:hypothetical protein
LTSPFDDRFALNARPHLMDRFTDAVLGNLAIEGVPPGTGTDVSSYALDLPNNDDRRVRRYAFSVVDVPVLERGYTFVDPREPGDPWYFVDVDDAVGGMITGTAELARLHSVEA